MKDQQTELCKKRLSKKLTEALRAEYDQFIHTAHAGFSQTELRQYAQTWLSHTASELSQQWPFYAETEFVHGLRDKRLSTKKLAELRTAWLSLPSVAAGTRRKTIDFEFYRRSLSLPIRLSPQALARSLCTEAEASLAEESRLWEERAVDETRDRFEKELALRLSRTHRLSEVFPDSASALHLWGLADRPLSESAFSLMKEYADRLEQSPLFRELAEEMGRGEAAGGDLKSPMHRGREPFRRRAFFFRGGPSGLRFSSDLPSVIPGERALFCRADLKLLFAVKYAEAELLSFACKKERKTADRHTSTEAQVHEEKRGPIIICIDTSGSMQGGGERAAKTMAYALARIALRENRACLLVSFSVGIDTLDLSLTQADSLERLYNFLRKSFSGGTDLTPPLLYALDQAAFSTKADLLVVSDFVMGDLSPAALLSMRRAKKHMTRFFALITGRSENHEVVRHFDEIRRFDVSQEESPIRPTRMSDLFEQHRSF